MGKFKTQSPGVEMDESATLNSGEEKNEEEDENDSDASYFDGDEDEEEDEGYDDENILEEKPVDDEDPGDLLLNSEEGQPEPSSKDSTQEGKIRSFLRGVKKNVNKKVVKPTKKHAKNIKKRLNNKIVEPIKTKANSVGNSVIDKIAEGSKSKQPNQKKDEKYFEQDILFDSEAIATTKDNLLQEEYNKQKKAFEKNQKISAETYVTDTIQADLESLKTLEGKAWKKSQRDAAEKILTQAKKKAEWLQKNDQTPRRPGFDYTKLALDQASETASDTVKSIIAVAQRTHNHENASELGIIEGIAQTIKTFRQKSGEEQQRVNFAGGYAQTLQEDINNRYNDTTLIEEAATAALDRAKKRAAYLSANDTNYSDATDYVEKAFEEAETTLNSATTTPLAKQPECSDIDTEILKNIIGEAKKKYREEKARQTQAEQDKFDVAKQTNLALADLQKQKTEIELVRDAADTDSNMKAVYDEQLKQLAKQMAEKKLEIHRQIRKAKEEAEKKEQEKKEKALADARAYAEKQQKNQTETASAQQKPKQPATVGEKDALQEFLNALTPEKGQRGSDDDDDDYSYGSSGSSSSYLTEKQRKKNYAKSQKALENIRPVSGMKNIINKCIDSIKNEISQREIDSKNKKVIERLKERNKNKKIKESQLQIISQLQKSINAHFQFHGTSIAKYENKQLDLINSQKILNHLNAKNPNYKKIQEKIQKERPAQSNASINYVIEMSSLLDKLDSSLRTASFGLKGTDYATKIQLMADNLHAGLFKDLGKEYLTNHKITVTNGYGESTGEFNAFAEKNRSWRSSWGSGTSKTAKRTPGNCYRAILRTAINICNAQTYLDTNASSALQPFVNKCDQIIQSSPHVFEASQIKLSIGGMLQKKGTYDDTIRALAGGSSGTTRSENAAKLYDVLKLLEDLRKSPESEKTINDIKKKLKELNNFSKLGIGKDNEKEFTRHLYENQYEQLKAKK